MSKKKILTGHVARLIDGVLVQYGPGDEAPNWVTNPDLLGNADETPETPAKSSTDAPGADTGTTDQPADTQTPERAEDELDNLGIKELRDMAEQLEISKSGSKADIAGRIRAKRAESEPAGENTDDLTDLIEKARALGFDDVENLTEAELQAIVDQGE